MNRIKQLYDGKLIKLYINDVVMPNGYKARLECIGHPGAALIIPVFDNGAVLLIRQFRPVINKYIWELPAGRLDKNEKPHLGAKRELIEETGYKAKTIKKIGEIYPAPGYTNEKIIVYMAKSLQKTRPVLMEDEVITVKIFTRTQINKMIRDGKIVDAKTLAGLYLVESKE